MLEFFRKYQRYFFIVIAVVIVISFSFFGTHSTIGAPQKAEDHCIGHGVDGSKLMKRELDHMVRLISSDRSDLALSEKGVMPNFFNDGVIRKDLLGTGIGTLLVNAYFDLLKEDLSERMEHHKNYVPYKHPTAPFIGVESLWGQVLPMQKKHLETFLHQTPEMNEGAFGLLVNLYLGESAFPPNVLREYLMYQQKHFSWIEPDPALERVNLNVFNARSLEEWFGPSFLELSGQFIINAALIAKERGYKVSFEEARVDLVRNGYDAMKTHLRRSKVSEDELSEFWHRQLFSLGMSEKEAVLTWQKVMLFRRLFDDVGGAVFVDPDIYETFYGFASKEANIDLYRLPKELDMKDFSSLMKLELYLDTVAKNRKEGLMLPESFATPNEVAKSCPELVEQRFLVEVARVEKDEIALDVSIKKMWEWQLEKENFELLSKEFPELQLKNANDSDGYFAALESLNQETRAKLDRFSRGKIVESHPEWIQDALSEKQLSTLELSISPNGKNTLFDDLDSGKELLNLLSSAALKEELESDSKAADAKRALEVFTNNHESYFRFHVIDRDLTKTILTFKEANERGALDTLLEKHLKSAYPNVRTKNPAVFKTEDNEWKDLQDVKMEVGRVLYEKTLKNIEKEASYLGAALSDERFENLDGFYPRHRLISHMRKAEKDVRREGESSKFLKQDPLPSPLGKLPQSPDLKAQWGLVKESLNYKNHEKSPWFTPEVFSMVEKSWSEVKLRSAGSLSFFQLQEKTVPSGNFASEIKKGKEILSKEAEQHLMTDVIKRLQETQAIKLTHVDAERS